MPEPIRSRWEIFAVERERITDRVEVATEWRYRPDMRAIDRADETMQLWHPQTIRAVVTQPERASASLMLLAMGSTPARIKRRLSVGKSTLYNWKSVCSKHVGAIILPHLDQIAMRA